MSRRLTYMQRAERWFKQQTKASNLRQADYTALTKRMALCYEPAVLLSKRNEQTNQDILQRAKELKRITEFKLS